MGRAIKRPIMRKKSSFSFVLLLVRLGITSLILTPNLFGIYLTHFLYLWVKVSILHYRDLETQYQHILVANLC